MVEQQTVETVIAGSSPAALAALALLGVTAASSLIGIVIYLIRLHIAGLPQDVKELTTAVAEISNRLWTRDEIQNEIKVTVNDAVKEHEKQYHP